MYLIAKLAQAAGLAIILVGFIQRFPQLMSPKFFLLGLAVFMTGWLMMRYSR